MKVEEPKQEATVQVGDWSELKKKCQGGHDTL